MAVYTDVSDQDVRRFLSDYDIGEVVAIKGIAEGVENSNFLLQTTRGPHILTLYEKRVKQEDLPFFLGLLDHLAARGFACPTPIHGRDGRALRQLCGRPAAIVSFLPGLWPRRIAPFHCGELGRALADLHLAAADYPARRANDLSLEGWRALLAAAAGRADEVEPGLAQNLEAEWQDLAAAWPTDLPTGIIHADMFPDNVFFIDQKLSGVIDFYFACTDFLVYDLAICVNAWCFEPDRSFNVTKARRMLAAYQARRPLTGAEIAAFPVLARGAALRFLATRLYDWLNTPAGALVRPKPPQEYLQRLRFHRRAGGPADYGFS